MEFGKFDNEDLSVQVYASIAYHRRVLMKQSGKEITFGIILIALSAITYGVHYLLFRDLHHIFVYMLGELAFMFIEVLLVTLIIHRLLEYREKQHKMEKLNVIIGIFFSEMGTELLSYFSDIDPNLDTIRKDLIITGGWTPKDFDGLAKKLTGYGYRVDPSRLNLAGISDFLLGKKDFVLTLMENPNLLEHERFTDLLRVIFHVADELRFRKEITPLPPTDLQHIAGDINRAYGMLVREWVMYMGHLKKHYPYLFSLAVRTNPFDQNAMVIVNS